MAEASDKTRSAETGATTIMVVDPEILVRMVIAEYLRECGYKVIEGVTAEDVFTVLRARGSVDVVLAEIRLTGEIDGFGLASQIRRSYPRVDVILASGVTNAANKAGDLCDDGPLEKPYQPQEVVRRINILRERRRTTQKPLR